MSMVNADSLYCLRIQSNPIGASSRSSKQNSLSIQSGIQHIGACRTSPIPPISTKMPMESPGTIKVKRQDSALTQEEIYRYVHELFAYHIFC